MEKLDIRKTIKTAAERGAVAAAAGYLLEREYKRDKAGKFASAGGSGGSDARRTLDEHKIARAKHTSTSWEEMPSLKARSLSELTKGTEVDHILGGIAKDQGFDGKPHVVSKTKIDEYVAAGETELFRGVSAAAYGEQFRSGDYFPGSGVFGSGTYSATARAEAAGYAAKGGALLRMTIKKGARIVDYNDLTAEMEAGREAVHTRFKDVRRAIQNRASADKVWAEKSRDKEEDLAWGKRERGETAFLNRGRYATWKGYDAIRVSQYGDYHYIVLNRTALRVQEEEG